MAIRLLVSIRSSTSLKWVIYLARKTRGLVKATNLSAKYRVAAIMVLNAPTALSISPFYLVWRTIKVTIKLEQIGASSWSAIISVYRPLFPLPLDLWAIKLNLFFNCQFSKSVGPKTRANQIKSFVCLPTLFICDISFDIGKSIAADGQINQIQPAGEYSHNVHGYQRNVVR